MIMRRFKKINLGNPNKRAACIIGRHRKNKKIKIEEKNKKELSGIIGALTKKIYIYCLNMFSFFWFLFFYCVEKKKLLYH